MQSLLRLSPVRIVMLALIAGLAVLGLSRLIEPPPVREAQAPEPGRLMMLGSAPKDFASALAIADQRLEAAKLAAAERNDEWLFLERLAAAHLGRARLTGDYRDYAGAQAALDRAFTVAVPGAGPHLSQAELHFQMHKPLAAERMLRVIDGYGVAPDWEDQAEIMALRGDINFYLGRSGAALARYRRAATMADSPSVAFREAALAWRTGDVTKADAAFVRTLTMQRWVSPQFLASIELQRGALDLSRGDLADAKAHYAKARASFPGHWLADAHHAQLIAVEGDLRGAAGMMRSAVDRSGDPTAMDALAAIHRALGQRVESERWAARAAAVWEERLKLFPEAVYGHVAEHHLAFGDPARALDLARRDVATRPYGGAKLGLAWALIANRRPAEALAMLEQVEGSGWVSAEQHVAAAQAHELLGDAKAAETERDKALAINPRALDRSAALIWFH